VDEDDGFVVTSLPDGKDTSVSKTCINDDKNCVHTMLEDTLSGHSVADTNMQHTLLTNELAEDNENNSHIEMDNDVDDPGLTKIITKEDRTGLDSESIDGQKKSANVEIDTRSSSCSFRSEDLFKGSTPPHTPVSSGYGHENQFPRQEQVPGIQLQAYLSGASNATYTYNAGSAVGAGLNTNTASVINNMNQRYLFPVPSGLIPLSPVFLNQTLGAQQPDVNTPMYSQIYRGLVPHTPVVQQPELARVASYEDPHGMHRRQLAGARGDLNDTAMSSSLTQQSHNITQNQGSHSVEGR